jgi:hypothetical protein
MQLLYVEIKIVVWKKSKKPGDDIVWINCNTTDVVIMTVQTDLSSDTANEVKLSDGEGKHVTQSRLEKMG